MPWIVQRARGRRACPGLSYSCSPESSSSNNRNEIRASDDSGESWSPGHPQSLPPGARISAVRLQQDPGQMASPSWLRMGASERLNRGGGGSDPSGGAKTPDLMAGEQQDPALRPRGLESQKSPVLGEHPKALAEEKRRLSGAVEISGDEVHEQATDGLGPWELLRLPAPPCRAADGENLLLGGVRLGGDPPGQLGAGAELSKPRCGTRAAPRGDAEPCLSLPCSSCSLSAQGT